MHPSLFNEPFPIFQQRTDEDVGRHLQEADRLATAEGSYKAAIKVITDELKIAYERFKTLMTDYQVLLSMCATFFTSVEKVCPLNLQRLPLFLYLFLDWNFAFRFPVPPTTLAKEQNFVVFFTFFAL